MTSAIACLPPRQPLAIVDLIPRAEAYALDSKAPNTRRAYRAAWLRFSAWAASAGLDALPAKPTTLAVYLAHLAESGRKVATIELAVAAIAHAHHRADVPSPHKCARVAETMAGIRRALGCAPTVKAPLLAPTLRLMCATVPTSTIHVRNRALLLLGFAGAFRRSELVALDVRDLAFTDEGLEVTIRKSKTDQQRVGRKIGIPLGASPSVCPVQAVRAWLDLAGIASGPVLRAVSRHGQVSAARLTGHSVAVIVKAHAKRLGLDPTLYAGHSLRAGFATSAAKAGKSEASIALQTGHKSMTVLRKYIRQASLFHDNAGRGLL